jgi:hypothetical protein
MLRVQRGGVNEAGATVYTTGGIFGTQNETNASGTLRGTVANGFEDVIFVVVEGSGFSYGSGPHVMRDGVELVIDVE